MKYQMGKYMTLSSAELAQRSVNVKYGAIVAISRKNANGHIVGNFKITDISN